MTRTPEIGHFSATSLWEVRPPNVVTVGEDMHVQQLIGIVSLDSSKNWLNLSTDIR